MHIHKEMIKPVNYNLYTPDKERIISIEPIVKTIPGGALYATGVFKLSDGEVNLGEIVFDDEMRQWEYTGMGDLTHEQASEIATFIQDQTRQELEDQQI
jgi:hypothetical protein